MYSASFIYFLYSLFVLRFAFLKHIHLRLSSTPPISPAVFNLRGRRGGGDGLYHVRFTAFLIDTLIYPFVVSWGCWSLFSLFRVCSLFLVAPYSAKAACFSTMTELSCWNWIQTRFQRFTETILLSSFVLYRKTLLLPATNAALSPISDPPLPSQFSV